MKLTRLKQRAARWHLGRTLGRMKERPNLVTIVQRDKGNRLKCVSNDLMNCFTLQFVGHRRKSFRNLKVADC